MKQATVTAEVPERKKDGKVVQEQLGPVTVSVDYTDDIQEATQMYGPEAILSNAFANWRVVLQSNIRSSLKKGLDVQTIQDKLKSAKMGVAQAGGVDPQQAYLAMFQSATPERQAEMLAELQTKAKAAAAQKAAK